MHRRANNWTRFFDESLFFSVIYQVVIHIKLWNTQPFTVHTSTFVFSIKVSYNTPALTNVTSRLDYIIVFILIFIFHFIQFYFSMFIFITVSWVSLWKSAIINIKSFISHNGELNEMLHFTFNFRLVSISYGSHGTRLICQLHGFLSNRNSRSAYPSWRNLKKVNNPKCSLALPFWTLFNIVKFICHKVGY